MAANTSSKNKKITKTKTKITKTSVCTDSKWFASKIDVAAESLKVLVSNHLKYTFAKDAENARPRDWCLELCHAVRDRI